MLQQYTKAMRSLQPLLQRGDRDSITIILVTCQLFTLLEYLRGKYQFAETHLRNGLKLLKNMATEKDRSHHGVLVIRPDSHRNTVDQSIVRSFATLHMQSNLFGPSLEDVYLLLHPMGNTMPYPAFASVEEAKDSLDVLLHRIILITQRYRKLGPGTEYDVVAVTSARDEIINHLETWYKTYLRTISRIENIILAAGKEPDAPLAFGTKKPPTKLPTAREPSVFKSLLMHHAMASIMCCCLRSNSEQQYEAYTHAFLTILMHAVHIFEEYSLARSIPNNVNLHNSIGEFGFIAPLYYTAIKCRHHRIRLHAIRLLRVVPLKEGTWDSFTAANIAETVTKFEEKGTHDEESFDDGFSLSEVPVLEDACGWSLLPEHSMFHTVEITTREDLANEVVVTCRRWRRDGTPENITFHATNQPPPVPDDERPSHPYP
jgi:hypothetical protein